MLNEWQELPFSEAVEINPKVRLRKGETYPFVDMKAVDPAWRSVMDAEKRAFANGGARFEPFDTLMARITPCLENGKIARYVASNGANGPAFGSTEFIVIRGKDGVTDNDFAYYLTKWHKFRQFAISQMTGSSGRQRVPAESLGGFNVPVPEMAEQRAIACILGSLDDKIELNRRTNETLEAMAQALFKSWFVDFDPVVDNALALGNPIPEALQGRAALRESLGDGRKFLPDDIRSLFPSEFEFAEGMGWIPKGWEVKTIEDVSEKVAMGPFGSSIKVSTFVSDGIPIVSGQHLNNTLLEDNSYNFITEKHAEKLKNSNVVRGDIVFTHAGNIGQASYIPETSKYDNYVLSQRQFYLRCHLEKITPQFLIYYFRSPVGQHKILANTSSTGVPSISRPVSYLKTIRFLCPKKKIILEFSEIIKNKHKRMGKLAVEIRILNQLRDTLLSKLLSGEIRIPDAEKLAVAAG